MGAVNRKSIFFFIFFLHIQIVVSQTGVIKGRVFDSMNNDAIPGAVILIEGTDLGTTSDSIGSYIFENITPGIYSISCSFIGYQKEISYELIVSTVKPVKLDFGLTGSPIALDEVKVTVAPFNKTEESPLSMRTINAVEVYRNPGSNRDISKVIQILPGVASTLSFRNDIIVRGGAPNENRFFMDGIEVPVINHFSTQGASGGPVGMINVDFIREVDFYSGSFPSNRGNALSSVLDFKIIEGNDEKLSTSIMAGSTDLGLMLNGPAGEKSTFLFSARRSYLQYLFRVLKLPFLPTYNDFQFSYNHRINKKNIIKLLGLAAIDDVKLNESVNNGLTNEEDIRLNNYILGNLPENKQWNYTVGAKWTHFSENSYQDYIISRNHLKNSAFKYQDNIRRRDLLILDYKSQEIENKLRMEHTMRKNHWKWNVGVGIENALYTNSTYTKVVINNVLTTVEFNSRLTFNKYSVFSQLSKQGIFNRLSLSIGVRSDFSDYSSTLSNPLDQLSPRISASFSLSKKVNLNMSAGSYYQLPPYTTLGYRDSLGILINKENKISYIQSNQIAGGLEYNPNLFAKFTIEAFYKAYSNYPFLLWKSISLANLGGDFGVIGNEPAVSTSKGRSSGLEFMFHQKLSKSIYGIFSYTFVRSEFKDKNGKFVPSSWDNKHILNISAGKKLPKNWEIGMKFRYFDGSPYTPYNISLSAIKENWNATRSGIFDWDRLNQERREAAHSLDIRVDKKWYFKKLAINIYLDIQNVYNNQVKDQPYLDADRDENGNLITDPENPSSYQLSLIENTVGNIIPSFGFILEF